MDDINITITILQIVGFIGALFVLVAYVSHQLKRMDPRRPLYNALNFIGGSLLFYVAFHPFQAGFVLMEGVWVVVSLVALFRAFRTSPSQAA